MASVRRLYCDGFNIPHEISFFYSSNIEILRKRVCAAVCIQKHWRCRKDRQMLKTWNNAATLIQKIVRGWLVRWHLPMIYRDYIEWRNWKHYNDCASKIQAFYKCAKIKKKEGNLSSNYLIRKNIIATSEKVRDEFKKLFNKNKKGLRDDMTDEEIEELEIASKKEVLYILFKAHHLLRTYQIEGIYSNHGKTKLSPIEKLLKSLPFKCYMDELRSLYNKKYLERSKEEKPIFYKNKKLIKQELLYRQRDRSKETKEIALNVTYSNPKLFDLNTKLQEKKYERFMLLQGKYSKPATNTLTRTSIEYLNISETKFNLHLNKKIEKKSPPPPYYIDLWDETKCEIHNCPNVLD